MIIVEENQKISDLLNAINCQIGTVKLDLLAFEASSIQHDELYVVEKELLYQVPSALSVKFENCTAIVVYGEVCEDLLSRFSNIVSFITDKTSHNLIRNQLYHLNSLIGEKEVLKSRLIGLNRDLNDVMGTLEVELLKVKRFYEQKVARRIEDVKGMTFFSKYSAGESSGGEFFDLYKNENLIFVMMSSTSSYLASSSILGLFGELKARKKISLELQQKFIEDLSAEVDRINHNKQKKIRMNLFSAVIDLSTLTVSGYCFGPFKVLSSSMSNAYQGNHNEVSATSLAEFKFQRNLERAERLMLVSPGLVKNWEQINPGFMLEELLVRQEIRPVDLLDEVFFQIKKDSESGLLSSDASAILLEVDKNVMLKV